MKDGGYDDNQKKSLGRAISSKTYKLMKCDAGQLCESCFIPDLPFVMSCFVGL